ncbi:tRNA (adenosine(37)-N6)-threonylcarbamoyltransferase complex ATPase subunit type 1 TsaE [Dyella sp. C9]|uniref:tRNA (adenosine(37)-N6)-threonylcarbamoyltransferase complex ATPase subunit type 1 TsaE n=1 Tax=Dyella sp. C9 TaxID=2202154 RepID=UPI000DEFFB7D|nr:tRNA (adenosine(37)-N6)-threonylcarbamoyltransferase complex ATPase subunit type 1 TsaE [Dyella sp. C9]
MTEHRWELADEAATAALAVRLAGVLDEGLVVYLHGDLGAGKTSFARALLRALGVGERIKSPTYSLIESYRAGQRPSWHLDLYRIADPGELEWLGLDALSDPAALVLVEWPERGAGALPAADMVVHLAYAGTGRSATFEPRSARGTRVLSRLAQAGVGSAA